MNKINYIIIHHTAVSYKLNADQWKQTNDYHQSRDFTKSSLGYYVGYNYEISAAGVVRKAREEGEVTCAVIGRNKDSVSICLDGNFDIEQPTSAQKTALAKLIVEVLTRHPSVPIQNVLPHRSFCGKPPYKSCFGKLLSDTWAQDLINNTMGNVGSITEPEAE